MCANLKVVGTAPRINDLLKSSVRKGARTSTFSFNRLVGSGSDAHACRGADERLRQHHRRTIAGTPSVSSQVVQR